MKITLRRIYQRKGHTNGILEVEGLVFATLEDGHNEPKIHKKTRTPPGTYPIAIRKDSPMAKRYAAKFGQWHQGMIWITGIPNFTYVYIHIGNDEDDTDGCPLIGTTAEYGLGFVGESTAAYKEFYPVVLDAIQRGEKVEIEITESFS